jgi:hypothetical protein
MSEKNVRNDSNKLHRESDEQRRDGDGKYSFPIEPRRFPDAPPPARSLQGTDPVTSKLFHNAEGRAPNNGQSSQAARDGRVPQGSHGPSSCS